MSESAHTSYQTSIDRPAERGRKRGPQGIAWALASGFVGLALAMTCHQDAFAADNPPDKDATSRPAAGETPKTVERVATSRKAGARRPGHAEPTSASRPDAALPEVLFDHTAAGTEFAMLPPQPGGPAPTLLTLATTGKDTPHVDVGLLLYAKGWNVVSVDVPCHGADRRPGEPADLRGWPARIAQGEDIVPPFQARVNDVLAHLVNAKLADPARIAAAGVSRGGYMAFQAAAGNPGIRAVAALAPVTDLLALLEFAKQQDSALARWLALANVADALAGRPAWIIIGSADTRVGTDKAIAFSQALVDAAIHRGLPPRVTLSVLPTPGHQSFPDWHTQAADWLQANIDGAR